ncbi:unnamed protein product [Brassica oleracea var. botrytis]|uniref:(rape) hypothetical protein n=1 Tax=Brassica napus TaxID=3708 RepID=A0A816R2F0_BRANA|nr:unnamed protein product [Brassica napus]
MGFTFSRFVARSRWKRRRRLLQTYAFSCHVCGPVQGGYNMFFCFLLWHTTKKLRLCS